MALLTGKGTRRGTVATVRRGEGLLYSTEAEAEVILVSQFYGP